MRRRKAQLVKDDDAAPSPSLLSVASSSSSASSADTLDSSISEPASRDLLPKLGHVPTASGTLPILPDDVLEALPAEPGPELCAYEAAHAEWLTTQPWWVQQLDAWILTPWWRLHKLEGEPYGNSLNKNWQERRGMPLYLLLFLFILWSFYYVLVLGCVPEEAFIPQHYPAAVVSLRDWLRASIPSLFCSESVPTDIARCCLFLGVYLFLAYAYCGFVTANRSNPFKGLHGGYRDLAVVWLVLFWWVWASMLRQSPDLFQNGVLSTARANPALSAYQHSNPGVSEVGFDGFLEIPAPIPPLEQPAAIVPPEVLPDLTIKEATDAVEGRRLERLVHALEVKRGEEELAAHHFVTSLALRAFRVLTLDGAMGPSFFFLLGTLIGQHIPYLVRKGFCAASISGRDMKTASCFQKLGIVLRLGIISFFASFHARWALERGEFTVRFSSYALVGLILGLLAMKLSARFYMHWHHWVATPMLAPLCAMPSSNLTLTLLGLLVAQHVDGCCRFAAAPLFHRHRHAASWHGYH